MAMKASREVLAYLAAGGVVYFLAVLPHVLDFGWAWGWPGAGLGFPLSLLGTLLTLLVGTSAVAWALAAPKAPRWIFAARLAAVPVLSLGPFILFGSFGGLATSQGRGLVARLRQVTPVEHLQRWAISTLRDRDATSLPDEVAATLPRNPRIDRRGDHVALVWYDTGVLVGAPTFRPERSSFFDQEVRPGIYVYVSEH